MLKVILFDLDGTLYRSDEIKKKFAEAAYYTMKKHKNIPLEDASRLVKEMRRKLKEKYGDSVPYSLTLRTFGIPIELWHKENIAYFDPRNYLMRDNKLRKSLIELKKIYRLAILTNNNQTQSERTLEALGLNGIFEEVFTYDSFKLLKPDIEFFKKALVRLRVDSGACLIVGDRDSIDLDPARELGMRVYKVNGPEDIYTLSSKMT